MSPLSRAASGISFALSASQQIGKPAAIIGRQPSAKLNGDAPQFCVVCVGFCVASFRMAGFSR